MNTAHHLSQGRREKAGQTIVFFAIMLSMLIVVVGMTVDAGAIYLTKASLDKAVDAASLMIVRNLFQGQTQATAVGQAAFAANYQSHCLTTAAPALNITYASDSYNNTTVSLLGTATVNTYFMRIIPRFQTFQISSAATAMRAKLVMSLVLDRSGSMSGNNGSAKLPGAVATFISFFDDNMDMVSLVSFSSTTNLNVSVQKPFKSLVTSAANSMSFAGGTYSEGGLRLGFNQNKSVTVAPGDNVIKLVVFFTDGLANTFQGTWPTNKTYNVGGTDSGNSYAILDPKTGNQLPNSSTLYTGPISTPYYISSFRSTNGSTTTASANNFRTEGQLRALGTATEIRNAGMLVFSVGLGGGSVDQDFLNQIANDTSSSTFNPNQPVGEAVFASTANDLQTVFQQIASKILLRLTK